jgi:hypothetical protein
MPRGRKPDDAVALSDGATQSANCLSLQAAYADWLGGASRKPAGQFYRPRRSKPLSSSTSPTSLASNRPAATAAISNANEKKGVSQLCREEITSGCDPIRARLLDPGCAAMT